LVGATQVLRRPVETTDQSGQSACRNECRLLGHGYVVTVGRSAPPARKFLYSAWISGESGGREPNNALDAPFNVCFWRMADKGGFWPLMARSRTTLMYGPAIRMATILVKIFVALTTAQ
jgi:hypothetical protein